MPGTIKFEIIYHHDQQVSSPLETRLRIAVSPDTNPLQRLRQSLDGKIYLPLRLLLLNCTAMPIVLLLKGLLAIYS
jgi:hypothetical protein